MSDFSLKQCNFVTAREGLKLENRLCSSLCVCECPVFVFTFIVSFQHLQFFKLPQLPLCCGESYSLSPTTFGHASLLISPPQSKHKLVSSPASVSTQSTLTSPGLLLSGEANVNNCMVRTVHFMKSLFLKLRLECFLGITQLMSPLFFILLIIVQKILKLHHSILQIFFFFLIIFTAVTSSAAAQW